MSPWSFYLLADWISRKTAVVAGNVGAEISIDNGSSILVFVDDIVLLAKSEKDLQTVSYKFRILWVKNKQKLGWGWSQSAGFKEEPETLGKLQTQSQNQLQPRVYDVYISRYYTSAAQLFIFQTKV